MHDMAGYSQFHDRVRNVMLANLIELQVTDAEARFLISPMLGGPSEAVIYDNPVIIDALDQLLTALLESGASGAPAATWYRKAKWVICPTCKRKGWEVSNYGNWHECPDCQGDGIIIQREED